MGILRWFIKLYLYWEQRNVHVYETNYREGVSAVRRVPPAMGCLGLDSAARNDIPNCDVCIPYLRLNQVFGGEQVTT